MPEHLTDPEAATLPFAGLTAWNAVAEQGRVRAGDVVLVQGTGGIPLFALQFAKLLGATVIVTSKNDEKLARARALGADHVINYAAVPEWSQRVLELTDGAGADLVMDPGGTVTMAQSIRAVRPGRHASACSTRWAAPSWACCCRYCSPITSGSRARTPDRAEMHEAMAQRHRAQRACGR